MEGLSRFVPVWLHSALKTSQEYIVKFSLSKKIKYFIKKQRKKSEMVVTGECTYGEGVGIEEVLVRGYKLPVNRITNFQLKFWKSTI